MDNQQNFEQQKRLQENDITVEKRKKKEHLVWGIVIFILGVIAGIVGLCFTVKFIFYLGMIVMVIGIIALIWGIFRVKRYLTDRSDSRD